ncbi:hypothetical protein Pelo_18491 [Pelomyxa schiedti]|nr:hypothetical protein Pelo_18491 [Pelomyxa schiedti]
MSSDLSATHQAPSCETYMEREFSGLPQDIRDMLMAARGAPLTSQLKRPRRGARAHQSSSSSSTTTAIAPTTTTTTNTAAAASAITSSTPSEVTKSQRKPTVKRPNPPKPKRGKVSEKVEPRKPLVVVGLTPTISTITPAAGLAEGARRIKLELKKESPKKPPNINPQFHPTDSADNSAETRMTSASIFKLLNIQSLGDSRVLLECSKPPPRVFHCRTNSHWIPYYCRGEPEFYIEPALLPTPRIGSASSSSSSSLLKVQQEDLGLLEGHVISLVTMSKREPHVALLVSRKMKPTISPTEHQIIFWSMKESMESKRFHEIERWLVTGIEALPCETISRAFVIRSGSSDYYNLGDNAVVVALSSTGRVYVIVRKNPAAPHLVQSAGNNNNSDTIQHIDVRNVEDNRSLFRLTLRQRWSLKQGAKVALPEPISTYKGRITKDTLGRILTPCLAEVNVGQVTGDEAR